MAGAKQRRCQAGTWLSANLRRLEGFVDRELRLQVEAERIRDGQVTCEEVIDEVIVSALSQEDSRRSCFRWKAGFTGLRLRLYGGSLPRMPIRPAFTGPAGRNSKRDWKRRKRSPVPPA